MTEDQLADVVADDLKSFHDLTTKRPDTVTRLTQPASINEQLAVFERAGTELRRRMREERQRLVTDFERRLAEYEATVRATIVDMRAAHQHELQAHERMVKRLETLG